MENSNYKSKKIEKKNLITLYDWLTNYTLEQIKKKKTCWWFQIPSCKRKNAKTNLYGRRKKLSKPKA